MRVFYPTLDNTMEIKLNGITINVNNNIDRKLLMDVIKSLGGMSC